MPVIINASTSTGLVQSADTSGIIQFQSNGSTKATLNSSGFSYPGGVVQVVSVTKTDQMASSATGWNDIPGLSAQITPLSTSNRILIISNVTGGGQQGTTHMQLKLVRNSTDIAVGDQGGGSSLRTTTHVPVFGSSDNVNNHAMFFLDSPSTTSATTYKVQFRNNNSNGSCFVNRTGSQSGTNDSTTVSNITLMEISA